jgi:hypothetical protein
MNGWGEGSQGRIFSKSDLGVGGWGVQVRNTGGELNTKNFYLNIDDGSWNQAKSPDNVIDTGAWYHVAIVRDGSIDDTNFYVNGIDVGEGVDVSGNPAASGASATIGKFADGDSRYFNGLIDEVKIWNYALTEEQVKMEYNSGAVRFGD